MLMFGEVRRLLLTTGEEGRGELEQDVGGAL